MWFCQVVQNIKGEESWQGTKSKDCGKAEQTGDINENNATQMTR
jgi:hypothetical protein